MTTEDLVDRHVTDWAEELLGTFPALTIEGARQVGKSTLATMLAERFDGPGRSATLDDAGHRGAAQDDPEAFVDQVPDGLLVIDEIQRVPELLLPIKASIDRNRRPGRYLLTGSADLLRLERTPDSLAGSAATVPLRTLSQGEILGRREEFVQRVLADGLDPAEVTTSTTRTDYAELLAAGGYPEARGSLVTPNASSSATRGTSATSSTTSDCRRSSGSSRPTRRANSSRRGSRAMQTCPPRRSLPTSTSWRPST